MAAILDCYNLSKSFSGLKALDNITFTINELTSTGLVGPNGAGKTTLFSLICGFLVPNSGTIRLSGKKPDTARLKGSIGILPQDIPMMRGISVSEQLRLFCRLQGFNRQGAGKELDRIVNLARIGDFIKKYPETLSYGQRKKVALAQALIGGPKIILLDEPTSGLDPVAANDVRTTIQVLRAEHTFIISSHNLDEIKSVCDEIIIIHKGKLVKHCRIDELVEYNNVLTILLENSPSSSLFDALASLETVVRVVPDPARDNRISIYFRSEKPDRIQFKILECLQQHNAAVIEFSRGSAFTDKVVELVSNE